MRSRGSNPVARRGEEPVAAVVGRVLAHVAGGAFRSLGLRMRFWDGSELPARGDATGLTVTIRDPVAVRHIAWEPNQVGLARAWAVGAIELSGELDDLLAVGDGLPRARISALDRARAAHAIWRLLGVDALRPPPVPAIEVAAGRGPRHSLRRDRSSVRRHYDVSNDFHRLVLGPSMVYSCAYFASAEDSLQAAQVNKLDLICRKLALAPGQRLLDIGCGWGALVSHAVEHYGVDAVGITLSEAQATEAHARLAALGPEAAGRWEIRVADYRELDHGPFDAVASVGMYEHVGLAHLDEYVAKVRELLVPGGLFLNHGITRLDSHPIALGGFMDRYVFPDGELHPLGELVRSLERRDMEIHDVEALRRHYGLTLRAWLANLRAHRDEVIALGGAERERVWQVYLTGSARAFERGALSVFQVLSSRGADAHRLAMTRERMMLGEHAAEEAR